MSNAFLFQEHIVDFAPAALDTGETKAVLAVEAGDVLLYAYAVPLVAAAASTDTTISLGDTDVDGFVDEIDTEAMTPGAIVAGVTASFPYVFLADDTIDVTYAEGTTEGATTPQVRFVMGLVHSQGG